MNVFPDRIVDSVNEQRGKVKLLILKTVAFDDANPSILNFNDQDGNLLDSVQVGIPNVDGLEAVLNQLENHQDNIVRNIKVDKGLLTTVDRAGILEYLNSQNITISDTEILTVEVVEGGTSDGGTTDPATFDADYQAVLDYATAQGIPLPDSTQQSADNQFLVDYKATGAWARDDSFLKFSGTADIAFKLIDWKQLKQVNGYGSLTWTTQGVQGNGANAWIDSLFDASLSANWTSQNASIIWNAFALDPNTSGWYMLAGNYTAEQYTRWYIITSGSEVEVNGIRTAISGFTTGVSSLHQSGDTHKFYNNTGVMESFTNNTTGVPIGTFGILARKLDDGTASSYSSDGLKFIAFGADKSDIEAEVRTVLETL